MAIRSPTAVSPWPVGEAPGRSESLKCVPPLSLGVLRGVGPLVSPHSFPEDPVPGHRLLDWKVLGLDLCHSVDTAIRDE